MKWNHMNLDEKEWIELKMMKEEEMKLNRIEKSFNEDERG